MRNFLLIFLVLGLTACSAPLEHGISDPFEASNRKAHQINKSLDKEVVRPIAILYGDSTPLKVQSVINNISMNFSLPGHTINYILQGKLKSASKSSLKFVVNSTLGVGGVYDASSRLEFETQKTDFGETMARWGCWRGTLFGYNRFRAIQPAGWCRSNS